MTFASPRLLALEIWPRILHSFHSGPSPSPGRRLSVQILPPLASVVSLVSWFPCSRAGCMGISSRLAVTPCLCSFVLLFVLHPAGVRTNKPGRPGWPGWRRSLAFMGDVPRAPRYCCVVSLSAVCSREARWGSRAESRIRRPKPCCSFQANPSVPGYEPACQVQDQVGRFRSGRWSGRADSFPCSDSGLVVLAEALRVQPVIQSRFTLHG